MVSCRSASVINSMAGTGGGLLPSNPPEDGPNRQPEPGQIPFAEDVAGHQLTGGGHVGGWPAVVHDDAGAVVHGDAHVGEGDARPQRVSVERRLLDRDRPVALWRSQSFGVAVIKFAGAERAG